MIHQCSISRGAGKFVRSPSDSSLNVFCLSGRRVSLYGPGLILHWYAFIECWRSVSNLVSFSRKFTSPSRCSMSASWLKTWTAVWPPLFFVSESGYDRNRPQPSNPNRISISVINVCSAAVIEGRRRSAPAARTGITARNANAFTDAIRGGCSVVAIGSQFKAIQHIAHVAVDASGERKERTARFSVVGVSSSL